MQLKVAMIVLLNWTGDICARDMEYEKFMFQHPPVAPPITGSKKQM